MTRGNTSAPPADDMEVVAIDYYFANRARRFALWLGGFFHDQSAVPYLATDCKCYCGCAQGTLAITVVAPRVVHRAIIDQVSDLFRVGHGTMLDEVMLFAPLASECTPEALDATSAVKLAATTRAENARACGYNVTDEDTLGPVIRELVNENVN